MTRATRIRWQAQGNDPTLDSRLASDRGMSKIHRFVEPVDGYIGNWGLFARRPLLCGRMTPSNDDWIGVWTDADGIPAAVCRRCETAFADAERRESCRRSPVADETLRDKADRRLSAPEVRHGA